LIKNIIFDLGNVLIKADFRKFKDKLISHGVSEAAFKDVFTRGNKMHAEFECGKINEEEFVNACIFMLDSVITDEIFVECYNGIFDEIYEMKIFLENLANNGKYNLYILSNTNPIHYEYALRNYSYISLIKNHALSYRLNLAKPDIRIYEKVIRQYEIIPGETVFIDDLKENCEAAEKTGIKSIHYTEHDVFLKEFKQLIPDGSIPASAGLWQAGEDRLRKGRL
jgi:FMN phosphatase YigB (HAD superfamily)